MPQDVLRSLSAGELTPAQTLMRLTHIAASSPLMMLAEYCDAVREVLPQVIWNPEEGEEVEVTGCLPVVWKGPRDFYLWADQVMGYTFSLATYLKDFVEEVDPEKRAQTVDKITRAAKVEKLAASGEEVRKKRGRPTNEEREEKGYKNENITFNDRGTAAAYRTAKLRRDHPEIADRMAAGEFKSVAHAERVARGEPEPVRMTPIYAHWEDPQAAATRIREKLGEAFAQQLKEEL
jgi:hypothetical protein